MYNNHNTQVFWNAANLKYFVQFSLVNLKLIKAYKNIVTISFPNCCFSHSVWNMK